MYVLSIGFNFHPLQCPSLDIFFFNVGDPQWINPFSDHLRSVFHININIFFFFFNVSTLGNSFLYQSFSLLHIHYIDYTIDKGHAAIGDQFFRFFYCSICLLRLRSSPIAASAACRSNCCYSQKNAAIEAFLYLPLFKAQR